MSRFCHLAFVQGALRQAAFMDPRATVGALGSVEGAKALLIGLWQIVKSQAALEGKEADLELTKLSVHTASVHGFPCALLRLPPALHAGEAHFVAMVLRSRMADDGVCLLQPPLYFFTLEAGEDDPDMQRTEFCQWSETGERIVVADGPPPVLEAFAEFVTEMVGGWEQAS